MEKNKMKTLNKKNLERINYLLFHIGVSKDLSDTEGKTGSRYHLARGSYYQAQLHSIELFEEFGICVECKATINDYILEKYTIEKEAKKHWDECYRLDELNEKTA